MNIKNSYHPYALITVIFWSLAYAFTKLALQHFSTYSLGFLRYLIASAAMVIVAAVTKMKPPAKKDILLFIASGGTGFFLYMITFNTGAATVSSATGSVIVALAPVLTAILARMFYNEKLMKYQWISIAVQFAGVVVLTMLNSVFSVNSGIIWLFGAAISLSVYNLLQRKLTKTYSSLQTAAYSIFFGTLMLAVFSPTAVREIRTAPPEQFLYIGILGIFTSAIAYLTWSKAFSKAKETSVVSNYMFLTPFLTSLFSFIILGEAPDTATFIGGAIILIGIFMFNFGGTMAQKIKNG
ncbi:MAG: DMT family transporter [Clostridiales bacterium]|nr:DMT family transporter [Clostridiales bacterium]